MIEDDDLWRLKMGRFSDADTRIAESLFRLRKRQSTGLSSRALAWRTRHVDSGWRFNSGPQVMVKVAGSRKSRSGVRACIRYVARLRATDAVPAQAFDEFGHELSRDAVLKVVDHWHLDDDADNLSAAGRTAVNAAIGERRRLRHIQAWHFVFSIKAEDDETTTDRLLRATAVAIDGSFTRLGYRVVWALHTDHPGRPHIHAVVKAVSDGGERLRCDIHGDLFDTLRCEFSAALSMAGLRYQAARREDRSEIRARIMTGQEPLRPALRKGRGDGDLVRRAPVWFSHFAPDYVERLQREGRASPLVWRWRQWWDRFKSGNEPKPAVPPSLVEAHAAFASNYRDPDRALASWQWLAIERARRRPDGAGVFPTRRLAEWYARHRPEVFGELLPGTAPDDRVRAILRAVRLPLPSRIPAIQPNPTLVEDFHLIRWRRRVERDRKRVAGSLTRLARIVLQRTGDLPLACRLLRRLDAALQMPVGGMPVVQPAIPLPRGRGEAALDPAAPPPPVAPVTMPLPSPAPLMVSPAPPMPLPARQQRPRRSGRDVPER